VLFERLNKSSFCNFLYGTRACKLASQKHHFIKQYQHIPPKNRTRTNNPIIPSMFKFYPPKLNPNNFMLWCNQITPLIRSLGVLHHLLCEEKPKKEVKDDTDEKNPNPNYSKWFINDGLLCRWLLGTKL
jgi:hypothetical protein